MKVVKSLNGIDKRELAKYISYLYNLGNAMFDYYNGRKLSPGQIELVANASDEDKIHGMDLAAKHNIQKDSDTFYKNTMALKLAKKRRGQS